MPCPAPLPFPCTDMVASVKLHEDAAMTELAAESISRACGVKEGRRMVRLDLGYDDAILLIWSRGNRRLSIHMRYTVHKIYAAGGH